MAAGAMASARMMVVVFMGEQTMTNVSLQGGPGAGAGGPAKHQGDKNGRRSSDPTMHGPATLEHTKTFSVQ